MVKLGGVEEFVSIMQGHPPLIAPDGEGHERLNMVGLLQVQAVLLNEELRTQVEESIGSKAFLRLAKRRYHEVVPRLVISMERRDMCVYGIDGYIEFIVDGALTAGLTHEMYLSTKELAALRREAHLRTARLSVSQLQTSFGHAARLAIACAVVAGVSPAEIGVDEASANEWIDKLLCRKATDARVTRIWNAYEARALRLNALEER
jgi:hypothetical protein